MIDMATKLVNDFEPHLSKLEPEYSSDVLDGINTLKETFGDNFVDEVFGTSSYLMKEDWEKNVLAKCRWIFDSSKMRAQIKTLLTSK